MSGDPARIRGLDAGAAQAAIPGVADVLVDCVGRGASVSFLWPLARTTAETFWASAARASERG